MTFDGHPDARFFGTPVRPRRILGMMHLLLLLLQAPLLQTPTPPPLTVDEIMARVAENQDRARQARTEWVYQQDVLARLHRSNGKLAREETWKYVVTPQAKGFRKEMQHFEGQYEHKGKMIPYDHPHYEYKGIDVDGDLISDLGEAFGAEETHNEETYNGESYNGETHKDEAAGSHVHVHADEGDASANLFPLTKAEQRGYTFKLEGREEYRGMDVYRVSFRPGHPSESDHGGGDADWKGEAIIEAAEFQPVVVTTGLAWGIPGAVKVLLGTDLHHFGFKITYKKVADGVWFPEVYGGEFYLKALFLYKRTFSISVKNSEFRKTDVSSKVAFETPQ
jgi:hypothetical protein